MHEGAAVLHLCDFRIRVVRVSPLLVRRLLLPLPVKPRQVLRRRCLNAGSLRQAGQERRVVFTRVTSNDTPHRRVGFQHRRIDAQRLPPDQARLRQLLQHPREDRLMSLDRKQAPRPRDRRMVGRRHRCRQMQKRPQAQRIGRAPRDGPLRAQPFEVPDKQQSEIAARRQTRPSHRRVERRAQSFDERVEACRLENPVQSLIERMPCALRQIRRRYPYRLLRPVVACRAHCHAHQCRT